jgi:hypothetical protein
MGLSWISWFVQASWVFGANWPKVIFWDQVLCFRELPRNNLLISFKCNAYPGKINSLGSLSNSNAITKYASKPLTGYRRRACQADITMEYFNVDCKESGLQKKEMKPYENRIERSNTLPKWDVLIESGVG